MIVAAHIARKLVQGRATQVRVPVGKPQVLLDGRTVPARCPYTPGETYAVRRHYVETYIGTDDREYEQRSTVPADDTERVVVTARRRTTLGDLTLEDIKREGFATRDDYLETWERHRGNPSPDLAVWVLTVQPTDNVRLLTPTGRPTGRLDDRGEWQGSELDYTSNPARAMRDEPPAVDAATADEFARRAADEREARRVADERHQAGREAQTSAFVDELLKTNEGRKKLWDLRRRISNGLNKQDAA